MDVPPKPSRPVLPPGLTLAERCRLAAALLCDVNLSRKPIPVRIVSAFEWVDALESEALKREKVPYVPPKPVGPPCADWPGGNL